MQAVHKSVFFVRLAVFLSGVFAAIPSFAQTPSPLMDWQYSTGEVLSSIDGPPPEWRSVFGPGVSEQPTFMGSKRYRTSPSAILDIRYKDEFFLSDGEGIGWNALTAPGFRAGIAVGYDLGRDTHDDPRIRNLPNIAFAPEPKIFAQYFLFPVVLTADLKKGIGGNNGIQGDVGAYIPLPLKQDKTWLLFVGPSLTMADGRYMNSYFGVSDTSSRLSGLRQFTANGGFTNAGMGATSVYLIGVHWLIESDLGWRRLLGDAARSPITETKQQFVADLNIAYRF
ncbi:MAG TPA: MipA/OmpV family protein [Magnetospirillaceae bacterium]|nr:MipA/OmpV family protein [Magnetospirillaceae bacterium]